MQQMPRHCLAAPEDYLPLFLLSLRLHRTLPAIPGVLGVVL